MANYKPIDLSKEDFRKYLDRQGVLDAITKVLVKCNTDRPENALSYLLENMNEAHGNLKTQLFEAHQEIERLKMELSALKVVSGENGTAPSTSTTSGVKEEPKEIDNAPLSNGTVEVVKKSDDVKGGEVVCASSVKQEKDAVTTAPSTSGVLTTDDGKAKEVEAGTTAVAGKDEAQEPVATVSASPANEAPEAKEPNTGGESK
ncbi:c-Myc-binding protein homolog [Anopheles maculipalpis]|uniref:c-Myc-binding protein homolog n=1 Tax=Anopheles maculipalpis TaxID=1496333 RepID=UPI0021592297|nr:c-Myc-binding protein homolog [Anopheles maculipalpis]